jgi:hypothetical protein
MLRPDERQHQSQPLNIDTYRNHVGGQNNVVRVLHRPIYPQAHVPGPLLSVIAEHWNCN